MAIKTYLLSLFLLFGAALFAQESNFNRFSVELTTGVHVPLAPNDGISRSKYVAWKQFQLSGRYMFTEKFGVKGHYGFNGFSNPDDSEESLTFNRLGLEGVVNIGKLLNVNYRIRERVGLLFHTGAGITFAKPSSISNSEHIGNFLIGFTGQIKLNNRFTLLGDMTYFSNFKQHYAYNGELLDPDFEGQSGSFVNVSIGIMYNLGEGKYHADWY